MTIRPRRRSSAERELSAHSEQKEHHADFRQHLDIVLVGLQHRVERPNGDPRQQVPQYDRQAQPLRHKARKKGCQYGEGKTQH